MASQPGTAISATAQPPPPSHLTTLQVDQLLDCPIFQKTETSATTASNRNNSNSNTTPLLVPLGKYAFVPGKLQPIQDKNTGEHLVQIRVPTTGSSDVNKKAQSGKVAEFTVSISDAKEWLQQHSSQAKQASIKPPEDTTQPASKPTRSPRTESTFQATFSTPFVDIQEQYDQHGTQTSANVVDITRQLQSLWSQHDNGDSKDADVGSKTIIPTTLQEFTASHSPKAQSHYLDDNDTAGSPTTLKPLSDQEYQQLTLRLEELERLEAEQDVISQRKSSPLRRSKPNKPRTPASSKTGGGWSKGFLNKTSTKTGKKNNNKMEPQPLQSCSSSSPQMETVTAAPEKNTAVSFDTTRNQVQEIPRIGTSKLPTKQSSSPSSGKPFVASSVPPLSKPLESSIFSGIIQERQRTSLPLSRGVPQRLVSTTGLPAAPRETAASTDTSQTKPKRRSRFAQERHGCD